MQEIPAFGLICDWFHTEHVVCDRDWSVLCGLAANDTRARLRDGVACGSLLVRKGRGKGRGRQGEQGISIRLPTRTSRIGPRGKQGLRAAHVS